MRSKSSKTKNKKMIGQCKTLGAPLSASESDKTLSPSKEPLPSVNQEELILEQENMEALAETEKNSIENSRSKGKVLREIIMLALVNNITSKELYTALSREETKKTRTETLMKLFAYFGGIFIFSGVSIYIGTFWPLMSSVMKISITLGSGIALYLLALTLQLCNKKNENMLTPLFSTSVFFQTVGLFVASQEFQKGIETKTASTLIFFVMLIQQILTLKRIKHAALFFNSVFFWCVFFLSFLDVSHANEKSIGIVVGFSLLCISYLLDKAYYKTVANFWYLIGAILFLDGLFEALKNSNFEFMFFIISSLILYFCTVIKNRILLFVSTLSSLGYIGYFTSKHFIDSAAWPILLVLLGGVCFSVGVLVVKISKKFN